jgi:NAD(P)-dependent dehydrogenase (short-subunit alcohol dehydrogenase family)
MATKAIVVGGTSGIGYAMACRVAAQAGSAKVIISGRTKPKHIPHPNMDFRPLDATSMYQIKKYTDAFKSSQNQKLDLLIMTQGIMTTAGRTETPEGIDRKMALHYYGKQLLIRELLPVLKEDGKVIIVFDGKFGNPNKLNWDDLDLKSNFGLSTSANHCMVMNDIMIQHFAAQQQEQGVGRRHFIHAWPGAVNTSLLRELPRFIQPLAKAANHLFTVPPETCAEYLLNGVSERVSDGEKQGRFWDNIDNKGRLIDNKTVWTKEQMNAVAAHTWGLIDSGIQSSQH